MDGITPEEVLQFTSGEDNQQLLAYMQDPQNGKVVADAMSFMVTHLHLIEEFKLEYTVVQFLQQFLFTGWLQKRQLLASDDMQKCQHLQRQIHECITMCMEMMDNKNLLKMCDAYIVKFS